MISHVLGFTIIIGTISWNIFLTAKRIYFGDVENLEAFSNNFQSFLICNKNRLDAIKVNSA